MFFKKLFSKEKTIIWNEGDQIQPFQLTTHTGSIFEYNGEIKSKLMIYFFPNAWSETYQDQILHIENNANRFLRYNIIPLAITTETPASVKTWAKTLAIRNVRILSDFWPHGYLANSFGILNRQRGCPERTVLLIDDNMTVMMKKSLENALSFDVEEIFSFLSDRKKEENGERRG
ncbi:MAG: redoxin domain-containing protein [Candidatus Marinimicrobia bacterium]|nr:redoxin domain-containing protein [Candidatus Neomarinimicrobiota bacterium]